MIRILFFADSHLGFEYPQRRNPAKRYRGDDFFKNFEFLLEQGRSGLYDLVIHGGDLFDRSQVPPPVVNRAYDALFQLADSGIPTVLLPGNHDRSTLPSSLFLQHQNLHIFYEPDVLKFNLQGRRFSLAGFPFVREVRKEFRYIVASLKTKIPGDTTSFLCMHQAIEGAEVANYTFRQGKDVIKKSEITGPFSAILSGHIHRHQVISHTADTHLMPIIYPGSIERTSFAEKDETKGYVVLEIGSANIVHHRFNALPSRNMRIVQIPADHEISLGLHDWLSEATISFHPEDIIRIESPTEAASKAIRTEPVKTLLASFLDVRVRHTWLRTNPKRAE